MSGAWLNHHGQPVGRAVEDWRAPAEKPGRGVLTGRHCRLEPLSAERHGPSLWRAWQAPDIATSQDGDARARWTYLGGRPFDDLAGCQRWLASQARRSDPAFMAVIDADSGQALGVASWLNLVPEQGTIELGHLSFSAVLSRTRIATEALVMMASHAFALGYRRLEWKCDALNAPSRRAAERLGFTFEGVFRQHRVVAGRNRDTAWFSLLDHEWRRLEPVYRRWLSPDNFNDKGRQRSSLSTLIQSSLLEA
ncbi:GNAT family N-acetyltransferase [Halomonas litopenaei]|uniref:GNAT family N-acetyltransferase n=1 Tax=Halomonas litopenaei TaxID=2109328 RepID=UPI003FA1420B